MSTAILCYIKYVNTERFLPQCTFHSDTMAYISYTRYNRYFFHVQTTTKLLYEEQHCSSCIELLLFQN